MADKPRAKARRAAALTRPVKLLDDPSKMTPDDRVRYFLGLPQGYPVNPEHWRNIQGRLMARYASRDPSPGNVPWSREVTQLRDAPMPQLSRALGMVKPSELAYQGAVPVRGHSEGGQGAYLTPFEMLLLKDTMGDELPGARQEGETVSQARARGTAPQGARQAAAAGMTGAQGQSITADDKVGGRSKTYTRRRVSDWFLPGGVAGVEGSIRQSERGVRGHIGSGIRDEEEVGFQRTKARQDAAKRPQNPRMGPVKRKHGGGY
jgi:hypothetical protein